MFKKEIWIDKDIENDRKENEGQIQNVNCET